MSGFVFRRWTKDDVSVLRITGGGSQATAWNPKTRKWISTNWMMDISGMGGFWAEFDYITDEEAAAKLLSQGVQPDELEVVMLGLNPDESPLARALIKRNRGPVEPETLTIGNRTYRF